MDDSRADGHKYLSLSEIAEIYELSYLTIKKRFGTIEPHHQTGKRHYYHLRDITALIDVRKIAQEPDEENYSPIGIEPYEMTPSDRRAHFQAEDLQQSYLMKRRKNLMQQRQLIPVGDVEKHTVHAFKAVAVRLDTLPDILERDGVISVGNVDTIIKLIDDMRDGLANDLRVLSNEIDDQDYE